MPLFADRVKDTTITTGTGSITLSGVPPAGFQSFATGLGAASVVVSYCIADQLGSNWEVGKGTFNGTTTVTRDLVRSSSNANALVNFEAGIKDVFVTAAAEDIERATIGYVYAQTRGFLMP
jgi:hypothetical protein